MGAGWESVPLGEVLRPALDPHPVDPIAKYPIAGVYGFGRGMIKRPPTTGQEIAAPQLFRIKAGQFIYSRLKSFEGAFAIVSEDVDGFFVSNEFPTFDTKPSRLDPRYLGWYFKQKRVWQALASDNKGIGARRERLHPDRLLEHEVPLPSLDEQRHIVAHIDALAAKIAEARGLRKEAELETKAAWSRCARELLLRLPASIPRRALKTLISMRGGGTPSKSEPRFWQGTIPWITPKDMKRRELYDAIDHISEAATNESPAKLIEPGAVLIVVRGMILAHTFPVALLRRAAAINQDMKALLPTRDVSPEYLSTVLWAMNRDVLELVDRSSHDTRKLLTDKLEGLAVPVPSVEEQRRIVGELGALQAKVDAVKHLQAETAAELDALLPAILDRAFKGEL